MQTKRFLPCLKFIFIALGFSSSLGLAKPALELKSKTAKPSPQLDLERYPALELLLTAQTRLSNEAARLQIQGKSLSKKEITRINALYQSISRLDSVIKTLKASSLEAAELAIPARPEK